MEKIMVVTYSTVQNISDKIQGRYVEPVILDANSGAAEVNPDRIQVGNTGPFTIGDPVHVHSEQTANTQAGEHRTISAITANDYITVDSALAFDYLTANDAEVQIKSMFSQTSKPDITTVERLINEAEETIDDQTYHSWMSRTETNDYYDIDAMFLTLTGIGVPLKHRQIVEPLLFGTDKLEVWDGTDYVDYLDPANGRTEGRDNDWWMAYEEGIPYLRLWFIPYKTFAVRMTYRYGATSVPADIQKTATLLAAADVLDMENFVSAISGGENLNIISVEAKQRNWRAQAKDYIQAHKEITSLKFNG